MSTGCQKSTSPPATPATPAAPATKATPAAARITESDLVGGEFELVSFTLNGQARALPESRKPTIAFPQAGRVGGLAGVNRYSGSYKLEGDKLVIAEALAMTRMAGPPEAMKLEDDFGKVLPGEKSVSLKEGVLVLESAGARLEFRKK